MHLLRPCLALRDDTEVPAESRAALAALAVDLAFLAPSERMRDWAAVPPPLARWRRPGERPPGSGD